MSRLTDYDRRIKQFAAAEETAEALSDISALRMQAIRKRFEKNQLYFDEIRALYGIVRASAESAQAAHSVEKVLYIAVTANRRFAGTLARDTVDALARALGKDEKATAFIIGRLGWQYFDTLGLSRRGRQILFAGEGPTPAEFASLLAHASRYDRVFVLYGRFVNAFRQEVAMEEISQSPEPVSEGKESYLFEPEVDALLAFFNAQVRYALLERVLLESELARMAARFVTMEEASQRAHGLRAREERGRLREATASTSAALLETYAGSAHWRTEEGYE
jgi:F-type H+-transporting ATPase subunit gamma